MSKVIITIESKFLPKSILQDLAERITPDEDTMHMILLQVIGVTPAKVNIKIETEED